METALRSRLASTNFEHLFLRRVGQRARRLMTRVAGPWIIGSGSAAAPQCIQLLVLRTPAKPFV
jgi:hypothetical protein